MSRIHICKACANEKNGVRTRLMVEHTCDREHSANVPVSGSACCLCGGSGIEIRQYYDEKNVEVINSVEEKCSYCNGTGIDAD